MGTIVQLRPVEIAVPNRQRHDAPRPEFCSEIVEDIEANMAQDKSEDRSEMSFQELLSWAWRETPPVHRDPTNLVIHLFAVPLFVVGHVELVAAIVIDLRLIAAALLCIVAALALQKFGHSLERTPPPPFSGPVIF